MRAQLGWEAGDAESPVLEEHRGLELLRRVKVANAFQIFGRENAVHD